MAGAAVSGADRGAAKGGGREAVADVEAGIKAEEGRAGAVAAVASATHGAAAGAITWRDCVADNCLGLEATYALAGRRRATYRFSIAGEACTVALGAAMAEGAFGVVKRTSDERVAAKQMKFPRGELLTRHRVEVLRNEMHMMRRFGHIYAWAIPPKGTLTLFMPNFGPRDLFDFLQNRGALSLGEFFILTVAVLKAFVAMQNQKVYGWPVVHRDIKPENIVINANARGRRPLGDISSLTVTVVDVAFAVAADEHWDGKEAFFTYPDLTWGIGTTGVVPTPRIGELVADRRLGPSYGTFWHCCERVLSIEGGTKTFDVPLQRLAEADAVARHAPKTKYCASTDLYAIGVLLGDMQQYVSRSSQREIAPFQNFVARACSMRYPIPATWVLAAAQTTQRDYAANGSITSATHATYAQYVAASGRLAALANQRATVTDAERTSLEAEIAALYANPLPPAAVAVRVVEPTRSDAAADDDGISLAPMDGSAEAEAVGVDDAGASARLLVGRLPTYGMPQVKPRRPTPQSCSPCCIKSGRFMLWVGALGSTALAITGILGLVGVTDSPGEQQDTILTASGASALVIFSCSLCCGVCTTPQRDAHTAWY